MKRTNFAFGLLVLEILNSQKLPLSMRDYFRLNTIYNIYIYIYKRNTIYIYM